MTDIAAPPPDEIAGLIERARQSYRWQQQEKGWISIPQDLLDEMIAALRSLAQEVVRLKLAITNKNEACQELAQEVERLKAINDDKAKWMADALAKLGKNKERIRELEGIVTGLDERSTIYERRAHELEAERDAMRAMLGKVLYKVAPYHQSWRIWDEVRSTLAKADR